MERYLLVKQAVHIRPHRCYRILQTAHSTHIHPLHIVRRQTEQDTQHRNNRCEREKRENRREEIEEDIQSHLRLIRRHKPTKDIICGSFHERN